MFKNLRHGIAAAFGGISRRTLIVFLLWALFIVWTACGAIHSGQRLLELAASSARFNPYEQAPFLFSLNLWGCVAGLVVGIIFANPFHWLNGMALMQKNAGNLTTRELKQDFFGAVRDYFRLRSLFEGHKFSYLAPRLGISRRLLIPIGAGGRT